MSEIPETLKYTKDHEWIFIHEDDTATIGISDHAQDSLGDITYVELPSVGDTFEKSKPFGVIESVKAASDVYMPFNGEVMEVNPDLDANPEFINDSPYEKGWMIRAKITDNSGLQELLSAADYRKAIAE